MRNLIRRIVLLAPLILATFTFAQFGGKAGFGEAFRPDILPRDMTLIVETLKLEDWQRPIVESLIEDYTAGFKTGCDTVREKMVDLAKSQKGASKSIKGLLAPISAWLPEKQRLFQEFMASVKGQLSDVQRERWPKFERTLRREQALQDSDLSGEGVDLIVITKQMQLPNDAVVAAQEALDEYEVLLDAALIVRDTQIDALMPKFSDAMESMDMDKGVALQMEIMKSRLGVRTVQDESIEKIAAALPAPYGADFRQRALAAGYREAFQPDPLASFFQVVMELSDLTTEQKTAIEAAKAKWEGELAGLREKMLATMRADEPNKPARSTKVAQARLAAKQGKTAEQPPIEAMVPLRNEKNRLVQETREGVMALLTQEQKDKMAAGVPGLRPPPSQTDPALLEGARKPGGKGDAAGKAGSEKGVEDDKPARKETVD
ncbi:MAG: hypothetical protein RJA12_805 [Planctomycetota bacterium]